MSSQEDLFATQETKKKVKYDFVVLCDKDENSQNPFSLFPTSMFSEKEIHVRWLESRLDDSSRLRSLQNLRGIQDRNLSLFGKFDEGKVYSSIFYDQKKTRKNKSVVKVYSSKYYIFYDQKTRQYIYEP